MSGSKGARRKTRAEGRQPFRLPPVMGHRGAAAHAPENTLASIRRAAGAGATWVEFDVMLTADGVPVLFHDDSLERVTGEPGLMAETPYSRVARLDAGAWFAPAFRGEGVPTLGAALDLLLELGLHPNMEIKPTPGRDVETAVAALEAAGEVWPADRPPPLVSSFSRMSLAAAMALRPDWPRALITFKIPADWQTALQALDCRAFHVYHRALDWVLVSLIHSCGCQVATFTINDQRRAMTFYDAAVDCVISDAPERALAAYRQYRSKPG
ncbi:MAG TPA: glycerophosphodiester phosphodiesterase family protein [Kiloniellales bacterium]